MGTLLHLLGLAVLVVVCLAAAVSLVFGVPGTFLIVAAGVAYAWVTGFQAVHWTTIGWLTLLALLGEGLELAAGAAGARNTRPSGRVTIAVLAGSFVGSIVGIPFLFGVGALLGALLGAFVAGALAVASEGGTWDTAFVTGLAALRGRLLGFVLKAAIAVVMIVLLMAAAVSSRSPAHSPAQPPASAPVAGVVPISGSGRLPYLGHGGGQTRTLRHLLLDGDRASVTRTSHRLPLQIGGRNDSGPMKYSAAWGE